MLGLPLLLILGAHPQDGPDADLRLAIEPGAARLAVTLNLVFVDEYVDPFREHEPLLHPEEYGLAEELGFDLIRGAATLTVDGIEVTPTLAGFEVSPPDPDLVLHFPRFGTRAMTKLRWSVEYPLKQPPEVVDFEWGLYPPDEISAVGPEIPALEIVAHVKGEGRSRRITLTESGPKVRWESDPDAAKARFLSVPPPPAGGGKLPWIFFGAAIVSLVAGRKQGVIPAGAMVVLGFLFLDGSASALEAEEANEVFTPLHTNLYRAFDYTRREDVYDALARSVHGDLLDELYDQVYASLIQAEEGGAVSEVMEVRHLGDSRFEEAEFDAGPGFRMDSRWQVDGAVFHFGHSHWRTNEYEARFGVAHTPEGWRLVEHEMQSAIRVDSAPMEEGEDL